MIGVLQFLHEFYKVRTDFAEFQRVFCEELISNGIDIVEFSLRSCMLDLEDSMRDTITKSILEKMKSNISTEVVDTLCRMDRNPVYSFNGQLPSLNKEPVNGTSQTRFKELQPKIPCPKASHKQADTHNLSRRSKARVGLELSGYFKRRRDGGIYPTCKVKNCTHCTSIFRVSPLIRCQDFHSGAPCLPSGWFPHQRAGAVKKLHTITIEAEAHFPLSARRVHNPLKMTWLREYKKREQTKAKYSSRKEKNVPDIHTTGYESEDSLPLPQANHSIRHQVREDLINGLDEESQHSWKTYDDDNTVHRKLRQVREDERSNQIIESLALGHPIAEIDLPSKIGPGLKVHVAPSTTSSRKQTKKKRLN